MANPTKDNSVFREVASKASIVKVISYYLGSTATIRKGTKYACRCPFHDDHNPSMQIDEQKGTFHCYVDDHKGDSIAFVEQYAKLKPIEALKKVCEICSLELPESIKGSTSYVPSVESKYPNELKALNDLAGYYELSLKSKKGEAAMKYLEKRGISPDIISHFRIGFAPEDNKKGIDSLRSLGNDVNTLQRAGILSNGTQLVDTYQNRIMFPIEDRFGHIVAFSGRRIDENQPGGKYINYRDTPLFRKSTVLYHYAEAKETASKDGYLYMVEGFMDAIAFVRAGINSVVATMGTALTEDHIKMISKLNVEVRLALDSDEPGQSSMERLLPTFRDSKIPYQVQRTFKGAKDADECLTKFGKDEFLKQVNSLYDPFLFLFGRFIRKKNDLKNSQAVLKFLNSARPYYLALDALTKEQDLRILEKNTELSIQSLKDVLEGKSTKQIESLSASEEQTPYKKQNSNTRYTKYPKKRDYENAFDPTKSTSGKYSDEDYVSMIKKEALEYCRKDNLLLPLMNPVRENKLMDNASTDYMKKLIELECELMIVLTQNRYACQLFQESQCTFLIPPFYAFYSRYLTSMYIRNPEMSSLKKADFNTIQESWSKEVLSSSDAEEESPFAMDDFEEEDPGETVQMPAEYKDFLSSIFASISCIIKSRFDPDNFKKALKDDLDLVRIYGFLKERQNKVWEDFDKISYIDLCQQIKNKGKKK